MLLAALLACQGGGGPAPLADTAPRLAVSVAWKLEVDALLPTDLVATADGGFLVLDGARGRGLLFDPERGPPTVLGDAARWGHPVRAAWAADDGVWIADPAGRLVKFDEDGAVRRRWRWAAPTAATPPRPGRWRCSTSAPTCSSPTAGDG